MADLRWSRFRQGVETALATRLTTLNDCIWMDIHDKRILICQTVGDDSSITDLAWICSTVGVLTVADRCSSDSGQPPLTDIPSVTQWRRRVRHFYMNLLHKFVRADSFVPLRHEIRRSMFTHNTLSLNVSDYPPQIVESPRARSPVPCDPDELPPSKRRRTCAVDCADDLDLRGDWQSLCGLAQLRSFIFAQRREKVFIVLPCVI